MRLDKIRLAALEATLRLYRDPDRLAERLPTLRLLARPQAEIAALAERVCRPVAAPSATGFAVERRRLRQPDRLRRAADRDDPERRPRAAPRRPAGQRPGRSTLAAAFRALPVPVIGRIADGALLLDLRCLEDADGLPRQPRRAAP